MFLEGESFSMSHFSDTCLAQFAASATGQKAEGSIVQISYILCMVGQGNDCRRVVEQSSDVSIVKVIVVWICQYLLEDMGTGESTTSEREPQVVDIEIDELVHFADKSDDHVNRVWY